MCPPAWWDSMLFHAPLGTDETFSREFSITKNTKPHEIDFVQSAEIGFVWRV